MRQLSPQISHLERDFDLFFIEEITFAEGVFQAMMAKVGLGSHAIKSIRHSVYENFSDDAWGETDIFVELDGPCILLIENKLTAAFQPDQAARYRARAKHHAKDVADVRTLLIAPSVYLDAVPQGDWDSKLSYEEIADAMLANTPRDTWRQSLFREAGSRAARVRSLANSGLERKAVSPELIAFKFDWYNAIKNSAIWNANPQIGSTDEFLYRPQSNPYRLTVWHHPFAGYLSVQIPKEYAERIETSLKRLLPEKFRLTRHPSTIYVDASVPEIDMSAEFADEWDRVDESMRVARQALDLVETAIRDLF